YEMIGTHLHLCCRNPPDAVIKINLAPLTPTQLPRPDESQCRELQSAARHERTLIVGDRAHQTRYVIRLRQSRVVWFMYWRKQAPEVSGRVSLRLPQLR